MGELGPLIGPFLKSSKLVIIFDECLSNLIEAEISPSLKEAGYELMSLPLKGGESIKTLETVVFLEKKLLPFIDRQTTLIAIGGGVIGDVVSFSASIFLRGIPWIYLPTTLLAQVDSSIGGKTAVNSVFGKNLIGSFHFPSLVVTDTTFLKTLPKKQLVSGLVELSKHALILDSSLFSELEENHLKILSDIRLLPSYILKSIQLKIDIINGDWFDEQPGTRQFLNLGHTFAHAFEAADKEAGLLHGEAVALGLSAAYDLAACLGVCSDQDRQRVRNYIRAAGLSTDYQGYLFTENILKYFKVDKKKRGETIRFILPKGIGKGCEFLDVPHTELKSVFTRLLEMPCAENLDPSDLAIAV